MNTTNAIIVHGAYGYPEENWFSWLKCQLEYVSIPCYVPALPTPDDQSLENWISVFNLSVKHLINVNTILIGHSLGAAFIFRWLEQHDCKLLAVMVAGAFIGDVGIERFDRINRSFLMTSFDWARIKCQANYYVCYHGTNDIYVSSQHYYCIANYLCAKKIIISNAGHFHTASGYTKFPHLLLHIKQIVEGI